MKCLLVGLLCFTGCAAPQYHCEEEFKTVMEGSVYWHGKVGHAIVQQKTGKWDCLPVESYVKESKV